MTFINDAMIAAEATKGAAGANSIATRGRAIEERYFAEENRKAIEAMRAAGTTCCGGSKTNTPGCCGKCKRA